MSSGAGEPKISASIIGPAVSQSLKLPSATTATATDYSILVAIVAPE